jgi:hypothetical protein
MGEIIYATSSLKAYGALLGVLLVLGLLGVMGIVNGIRRKHEKMFVRVARGCSGVFFWGLGLVLLYVVFNAMTTGSKTMTVQVNAKHSSNTDCVNGGMCYVLESQTNSRAVNLVISDSEAYNKIQVNSCYLVKYFSGDGLFGRLDDGTSYDKIDTVTQIETAACPSY